MSYGRIVPLGPQRIAGAWFAPRTRVDVPFRVLDTGRADLTHHATDTATRTAHLRDRVLRLIKGAERKVYFGSFLFSDEAVVAALQEAAERLHGGVYILTALGKHLQTLPPDAELDADGDAVLQRRAEAHGRHLRELSRSGAWLRSADLHAKLCVVDDARALVTSANATQESYERNPENGLEVAIPSVARDLGRLFAHVWMNLTTEESAPGDLDVRSLEPRPTPPWRPLAADGPVRPVATINAQEQSLLRAALEVIDSATRRLTIGTYSLIGIEKHPLGEALRTAVQRGVEVDLILHPRNHLREQRVTCQWLRSLDPSRVRLHAEPHMHAKAIAADGTRALVWTGNLEVKHGWDSGVEVGLRVDDPGVTASIEALLGDLMARRSFEALGEPTVQELAARLGDPVLAGEYRLELPPRLDVDGVADALWKAPLRMFRTTEGHLLHAETLGSLVVHVNEPARRIRAVNHRAGAPPRGSVLMGWLAGGVLHVSSAQMNPAVPPKRRPRQRGRP
jgi:phosphatidylserine/phosphatidylglycerophosphate/cardiolipin synthase-like enzyme